MQLFCKKKIHTFIKNCLLQKLYFHRNVSICEGPISNFDTRYRKEQEDKSKTENSYVSYYLRHWNQ